MNPFLCPLYSNSYHLLVVLLALGALPSQLRGEIVFCTFVFELQLGPRSVIKADQCRDGDKKRLRKPHLVGRPTTTSIINQLQNHEDKGYSLHYLEPVTENSGWDIWWRSFRLPDRHRFLPISSFFPQFVRFVGVWRPFADRQQG